MMCIGRVRGWRGGSRASILVDDNYLGRLGAYTGSVGYSVADQRLPKPPGNQRPIGSVERSAAFENVLVFNHGHFAAAGVEKSSTTSKVGV